MSLNVYIREKDDTEIKKATVMIRPGREFLVEKTVHAEVCQLCIWGGVEELESPQPNLWAD